ncbi:hypothetical protein TNCV_1644951 [Trichonephila clavipes]|nr:hypothetical protein TNCV_1644951 [Trichonephila clavipes]
MEEENSAFDYQKTSLAGLALDSAKPVVASGEPPLCNAGPHPGTTWSYKTGGIIHQLIEQPGHAVFAKEEVFRSQWGAYALWKSARTLEHSCCQCTHKNDGG